MNKRLFLCVVLFCLSSLPALAELSAESPRVWVVALGVSKYIQPLNALPKASQGAQSFAEALASGRPESTDMTLLTTDSEDETLQPTKANVVRSLTQLAQNVKPADLAVFYFCGHGIEIDGQQFLLTKEADLSSSDGIEASTLSLKWLRKKMETLPCSGRLVILDACRETPTSLKRTGGVGEPAPMTKDFLVSGGGWQSQPGKVSVTLFGCDEGEQVHYGKNGSFFTEALVDGLSGSAADKEGQVTLQSLAAYAQKRVPESVHREFGKDAEQMPVLMGMGKGIVLRPSAGHIACFALDGEYGEVFAEVLQTRLAESGAVHLVERSSLTSAMKELKLQNSGLTDSETAQQLGKLVNAKYVLAGSSKKGPDGKLVVMARLMTVATGQNIPGVAATADIDPADWRPSVTAMADDLLDRMRGQIPLTGLAAKPATPLGRVPTNPKDGAEMVWVPAGEFVMGNTSSRAPQHTVYLNSYYIYKYEVTVAQYRQFCQATSRKMPDPPSWGWIDDHPVVNVTWQDAADYAQWAEASLPTEAQWEKAARGTDGRTFPWGNSWDASRSVKGSSSPQPVGSKPSGVSPYGCMDMSGNVWEWCADWYDKDYYKNEPARNPMGPSSGSARVSRGGSWDDLSAVFSFQCAFRFNSTPDNRLNFLGFRCARTP